MKFRSILCVAALAVVPAFATDLMTTETVGWLKVDSSAVSTIVSVPWVQVGGDGASVQVAKLVKTDSLKAGVMLYYYDGSAYWAWTMQETTPGVTNWSPTIVTSGNGPQSTSASKDIDFALPRGKALFVYRPNGAADGDIYLYGKYTDASIDSITTATGSADTPAYTLIGNPSSTDVALNASGRFSNVGSDDLILVPGADGAIEKTLTWANGAWGWNEKGTPVTLPNGATVSSSTRNTNVTIPAGRGVWYVSKGGTAVVQF